MSRPARLMRMCGIASLMGFAASGTGNATTLQLCNSGKVPVEFAIGFSERNDLFTTKGWWKALPARCSESIPRGPKGIYYLHVKRVGGGSIELTGGGKTLQTCASLSNFTDQPSTHRVDGKLACGKAGMITLKFVRFEMSRADLAETLTLDAQGAIRISNTSPAAPAGAERTPEATPPRKPAETAPPQRPSSAPPPQSRTPEACKRYPSLC